MVLRIERASRGQFTILRLSGHMQSEHVEELKAQMEGHTQKLILDLSDVKLVDRDAVCFLATCEAKGVELKECSPYIRDWIARELWGYATHDRRLVNHDMHPQAVRSGLKRILVGPGLYGVSMVLCFVSVWISLAIYVIVPLIYILPGSIDRHWQSTEAR